MHAIGRVAATAAILMGVRAGECRGQTAATRVSAEDAPEMFERIRPTTRAVMPAMDADFSKIVDAATVTDFWAYADAAETRRLMAKGTLRYRKEHEGIDLDFAKYPNWEQLEEKSPVQAAPYVTQAPVNPLRNASKVTVLSAREAMDAKVDDPEVGWVYCGTGDLRIVEKHGRVLTGTDAVAVQIALIDRAERLPPAGEIHCRQKIGGGRTVHEFEVSLYSVAHNLSLRETLDFSEALSQIVNDRVLDMPGVIDETSLRTSYLKVFSAAVTGKTPGECVRLAGAISDERKRAIRQRLMELCDDLYELEDRPFRLGVAKQTHAEVELLLKIYWLQHGSHLPDFATYPHWEQLVNPTTREGKVGAEGECGPYIRVAVANPVRNSSDVMEVDNGTDKMGVIKVGKTSFGWVVHPSVGVWLLGHKGGPIVVTDEIDGGGLW